MRHSSLVMQSKKWITNLCKIIRSSHGVIYILLEVRLDGSCV
jgi:hypothetical protein